MGDRLATIDMGRKTGGGTVPSWGRGAGSPSNTIWPGPRPTTKWHLDPSSRLATTDMGQNIGGYAPLMEGELGPHLTQCGQGRGLPPCQVSS